MEEGGEDEELEQCWWWVTWFFPYGRSLGVFRVPNQRQYVINYLLIC